MKKKKTDKKTNQQTNKKKTKKNKTNTNKETICEICSKVTIKKPERPHCFTNPTRNLMSFQKSLHIDL